jgi:hypothetical protein
VRPVVIEPFEQVVENPYANTSVGMACSHAYRADLTFISLILRDAQPYEFVIAFYRKYESRTLA